MTIIKQKVSRGFICNVGVLFGFEKCEILLTILGCISLRIYCMIAVIVKVITVVRCLMWSVQSDVLYNRGQVSEC